MNATPATERPATAPVPPRRARRRGVVVVLCAFLIPVAAVLAAFAVDLAWIELTRVELRAATDAAARTGAEWVSLERGVPAARLAAIEVAARNTVAGDPLRLRRRDVRFGGFTFDAATGRYAFDPSGRPRTACRVVGGRNGRNADGPVNLFFGNLLGVNSFETELPATAIALDRDIALVVDRSYSMAYDVAFAGDGAWVDSCGPLGPTTRMAVMSRAVDQFLSELRRTNARELVSLSTFSSRANRSCSAGNEIVFDVADTRVALTDRYRRVGREVAGFLETGTDGNTAIGEGLRFGLETLRQAGARPEAAKTVVITTDGIHNYGEPPIGPARDAAAENVTVHTITFSPAADIARMEQVARVTGGIHVHADTTDDLVDAFRIIARTVPVVLAE